MKYSILRNRIIKIRNDLYRVANISDKLLNQTDAKNFRLAIKEYDKLLDYKQLPAEILNGHYDNVFNLTELRIRNILTAVKYQPWAFLS